MPRSSIYVPVLRTHAAERDAVRELSPAVRAMTAPLFEVSVRSAAGLESLPARAVARRLLQLTYGSAGKGELYLDVAALMGRDDAYIICTEIERLLLSLRSDAQFVFALADFSRRDGVAAARQLIERNGFAFRVKARDYADPALWNVHSFLRKIGAKASNVDLLVDFGVVREGERLRTAQRLERDNDWRSVTYLGGSFPPNLIALRKNEEHELPRHEWLAFMSEGLDRKRTRFGDYTVQHPLQADPPLKILPSGSIRYTSDTYWVVMRGEKLDNPNGPGFEQYIGQAQLLCERHEYLGKDYSAGDEYIYVIATEMKRTGSPKTWLQAAMNHHMTVAARQILAARAA